MNTQHFKEKLLEEKTRLEKELTHVGRINPDNPEDWEPTMGKDNVDALKHDRADSNVVADSIEEFEARSAVEVELENRLEEIKAALQRIEDGTYGICEISGEPIEEDRLEANPAARTSKAHMNDPR